MFDGAQFLIDGTIATVNVSFDMLSDLPEPEMKFLLEMLDDDLAEQVLSSNKVYSRVSTGLVVIPALYDNYKTDDPFETEAARLAWKLGKDVIVDAAAVKVAAAGTAVGGPAGGLLGYVGCQLLCDAGLEFVKDSTIQLGSVDISI
jgi:hypothetical protein